MSRPRRVTVHPDPEVHLALRDKAAETGQSISHLVNEAVRRSLAEDAECAAAASSRIRQPLRLSRRNRPGGRCACASLENIRLG
jgi:hypothetical protein